MKVLHICSYYINDKFYKHFFDELKNERIDSEAFVFASKKRNKENISLEYARISYCFRSLDRFFFHLKHKKAFEQCRKQFDFSEYDCSHAHSLFSNGYLAYRIKKQFGIPYVITVRYPDIYTFFRFRFLLRGLGKKILNDASKVIFLSETSQTALEQYLNGEERKRLTEKSTIVPNGIDDFWLQNKAVKGKKKPDREKLKILFVGRINRNKNIEILFRICDKLSHSGKKPELTLVGQMTDNYYENLIHKKAYAKFYPFCDKTDLIHFYREADLFVLLSHRESFGLVYAEAMSQGTPVIYTRNQGFDGQFEQGHVGYSCSDTDEEEAIAAISKILEQYEQISANCIKEVDRYAWKMIGKKHVDIYKTLKGNESLER